MDEERYEIKAVISTGRFRVFINGKPWEECDLDESAIINATGATMAKLTSNPFNYQRYAERTKLKRLLVQVNNALKGVCFKLEPAEPRNEYAWKFCVRLMDMLRRKTIYTDDTNAYIFNKVTYDLKKRK